MSIGTTTSGDGEMELRPGGMVVQKRTDHSSSVPRGIRVRVKYGSVHHEISINSQSTFGKRHKTFRVIQYFLYTISMLCFWNLIVVVVEFNNRGIKEDIVWCDRSSSSRHADYIQRQRKRLKDVS